MRTSRRSWSVAFPPMISTGNGCSSGCSRYSGSRRRQPPTARNPSLPGVDSSGTPGLGWTNRAGLRSLHWADDSLLAFLEHVVEYADDVPLMLVATARPELFEHKPMWASTARNANRIDNWHHSLHPRRRRYGGAPRTSAPPGGYPSGDDGSRVGGNPFYAEEFVRLLKDRGIRSPRRHLMAIRYRRRHPPSGRHPWFEIAARLDTLLPERKLVLQHASVLGKVFWTGALAVVSGLQRAPVDAHLHELSRKELVRKARTPSIRGEREYAFWHVLVRDVCYSQIPGLVELPYMSLQLSETRQIAGARTEDHARSLPPITPRRLISSRPWGIPMVEGGRSAKR